LRMAFKQNSVQRAVVRVWGRAVCEGGVGTSHSFDVAGDTEKEGLALCVGILGW
jgi:hypothetical protein